MKWLWALWISPQVDSAWNWPLWCHHMTSVCSLDSLSFSLYSSCCKYMSLSHYNKYRKFKMLLNLYKKNKTKRFHLSKLSYLYLLYCLLIIKITNYHIIIYTIKYLKTTKPYFQLENKINILNVSKSYKNKHYCLKVSH